MCLPYKISPARNYLEVKAENRNCLLDVSVTIGKDPMTGSGQQSLIASNSQLTVVTRVAIYLLHCDNDTTLRQIAVVTSLWAVAVEVKTGGC